LIHRDESPVSPPAPKKPSLYAHIRDRVSYFSGKYVYYADEEAILLHLLEERLYRPTLKELTQIFERYSYQNPKNLCGVCRVDMGYNNPRQLCCKTFCGYEETENPKSWIYVDDFEKLGADESF
jgi:hypothetical protein